MSDKERSKLLNRIRKLLALAKSPNENEAMAAAQKAQRLLAEHNLSEADVKEDLGVKINTDDIRMDNAKLWRRPIAVGTALLYFCISYYRHDYPPAPGRKRGFKRVDVFSFVGEPHNLAVVELMFDYLIKTVERLANEGARKVPKTQRAQYKTSFKNACASRLHERMLKLHNDLRAGKATDKGKTTLPALASLYDQALAQIQPHLPADLRDTKRRMRAGGQGLIDGLDAGDQIGLDTQITGSGAQHVIGN